MAEKQEKLQEVDYLEKARELADSYLLLIHRRDLLRQQYEDSQSWFYTKDEIITELNKLGGENGIGIVDIVENRVVGMKSRGVYETPGGTILMAAHEQLEELTLDRETMETKKKLGSQFAQVVYEGKWYTPLREAIQAFVESTQKYVTGEVKFKLYKGNIIKAGTTSPYSLYNESLASFTTGDLYDHHDADGFITLFGLPLKVRAMMLKEVEQNKK